MRVYPVKPFKTITISKTDLEKNKKAVQKLVSQKHATLRFEQSGDSVDKFFYRIFKRFD